MKLFHVKDETDGCDWIVMAESFAHALQIVATGCPDATEKDLVASACDHNFVRLEATLRIYTKG